MRGGSVQAECPWCHPGVPQPAQGREPQCGWPAVEQMGARLPGREDTEPNQAFRWPKSSLCPQAPSSPALAAALHGEGALGGLSGTPGAGNVLYPFCDPCVWESEQERERASLLSV